MKEIISLGIPELKSELMEIDSKDLIEYIIRLDIQQRKDLLGKVEVILGKPYANLIENAISH